MRTLTIVALALLVALGCSPPQAVEDAGEETTPSSADPSSEVYGPEAPQSHPRDPDEQDVEDPEDPEEPEDPAPSDPAPIDPKPAPAVEPQLAKDEALVIGTYALKKDGVVDGDTIRVEGIKKSLRLLGIDTEEKAHPRWPKPRQQALMKSDWPAYVKEMNQGRLPRKFATPMGQRATDWAKQWFGEGRKLRLEKDDPSTGPDRYGRVLCYVWLMRENQKPLLYNVEAVRAGMTPYFNKYGRSKRFDAVFRAAQAEAQANKRGIWAKGAQAYPDYEVRLAWWNRRAEALSRYRALQAKGKAPLNMDSSTAISALLRLVGQDVSVMGVIDDHDDEAVQLHEDGSATLRIGGRNYIELALSPAAVKGIKPTTLFGQIVRVDGPLDREGSMSTGAKKFRYMRIKVDRPEQLVRGWEMPVE